MSFIQFDGPNVYVYRQVELIYIYKVYKKTYKEEKS